MADQLSALVGLVSDCKGAIEDQGRQVVALAATVDSVAATLKAVEGIDVSGIMGQLGGMFGLPAPTKTGR